MHTFTCAIAAICRQARIGFFTFSMILALGLLFVVVIHANGITIESQHVVPADGTTQQFYGAASAISGNTVVIGAPSGSSGPVPRQGSVYVYTYDLQSWTLQTHITPGDGFVDDAFGGAVALEGDTLAIGARGHGAVYVYTRSNGTWTFQAQLLAPPCNTANCNFASSVSISGGTIFVAAPNQSVGTLNNRGSVFVYAFANGQWTLQQQLSASDGFANQLFANSLSSTSDTLVVGAYADTINGRSEQGSAYIFVKANGTWTFQTKLIANDGAAHDLFGAGVGISGDTVVVGSPDADINSVFNQGAAYVFVRIGTTWSLQTKLIASNGEIGAGFGNDNVAIDDDLILVGAPSANSQKGSAYTFTRNNSVWTEKNELRSSDGQLSSTFGDGVALQGDRIVITAAGQNAAQGGAYFFIKSVASPDLASEDDSGISNTDNITNDRSLNFTVNDVTPGAVVDVMRDSTILASVIANSNTVTFSDPLAPENVTTTYSARQTINGETTSPSLVLVTVDTAGPVPIISQAPGQQDPTRFQPLAFRATFNEPFFGSITNSNISLAGSTANVSSAVVQTTIQNTVVEISVSNVLSDGSVVVSIPGGLVQDAAGNLSSPSTVNDNSITIDTVGPLVTVNQAANQPDPSSSRVNFTVAFNEPVNGFGSPTMTFSSSTINPAFIHISSITGGGNFYNVAVDVFGQQSGTVVMDIPAGVLTDAAGNANSASTSTDNKVTVDTVNPTVTVNQASGQVDPAVKLPIRFQVQFSEPVSGLTPSGFSYAGSTVDMSHARATISGSGTNYEVAISNIVPNGGFVRVSLVAGAAHDAVGNNSLASTSNDNTVVFSTRTLDGGFESTTANGTNPFWNSTSTRFGTSLCTLSVCGNGGGTASPRTGNGWVWFDGTGQPDAEAGTVSQVVNFPSGGSAILSYYLRVGLAASPFTSTLQVKVDGVTMQTVSEPSASETGYTQRTVDLSAFADGAPHLLSFEYNRPAGAASDNFSLDDVSLMTSEFSVIASHTSFDFDGDGKTDIGITRLNGGVTEWWLSQSSNSNVFSTVFGVDSDISAPGDFTGDGKTDIAVFRSSTGQWFVLRSEDFSFFAFPFGADGDIPLPADYDGDGKTDPAVFRPSSNTWFISRTSDGQSTIAQFGAVGDKPVPADYDGDGKADIAIYRTNNGAQEWWVQRSSAGLFATVFGIAGDKAVAGDYTGDGKTDIAVWRPSNGNWFVLRSEDFSFFAFPWGANGDIPAPGDYDGDGKFDAAVFRQSGATWYINRTGGAGPLITSFGAATDNPVAGTFVR